MASAQDSGPDDEVPAKVEKALGPGTTVDEETGLYEVPSDEAGKVLTHGPDPVEAFLPSKGDAEDAENGGESSPAGYEGDDEHGGDDPTAAGVGLQLGDNDEERKPRCSSDYSQHLVYAYRAGQENRYNEQKPKRQALLKRQNWLLNWESHKDSGPPGDYKMRCDASGVALGQFSYNGTPTFMAIRDRAIDVGYNESGVHYTIFVDDNGPGSAIGVGQIDEDPSLSVSNLNNQGGNYSAVWRNPDKSSGYNGFSGIVPMHENGHNQGAVQYDAPNGTGHWQNQAGGWHCNEGEDVMCYAPDDGPRNQTEITNCPDNLHFDCNHDDYFDSTQGPNGYLGTHWNLGSPLNRFIQFGWPPVSTFKDDPNPLGDGEDRVDATGAEGQWNFYRITVPSGTDHINFTLTANETCSGTEESCIPDIDLYVRRDEKPNFEDYLCRRYGTGSNHQCVITVNKAGLWYIGVRNFLGSTTGFTIEANYVF